jgi:hypothetical protein
MPQLSPDFIKQIQGLISHLRSEFSGAMDLDKASNYVPNWLLSYFQSPSNPAEKGLTITPLTISDADYSKIEMYCDGFVEIVPPRITKFTSPNSSALAEIKGLVSFLKTYGYTDTDLPSVGSKAPKKPANQKKKAA